MSKPLEIENWVVEDLKRHEKAIAELQKILDKKLGKENKKEVKMWGEK